MSIRVQSDSLSDEKCVEINETLPFTIETNGVVERICPMRKN